MVLYGDDRTKTKECMIDDVCTRTSGDVVRDPVKVESL